MPKATKKKPASGPEEITRAIYAVVKAIPRGAVATYGQVAELAGLHNGHRRVARAMRFCPDGLPWQRVVGRKDARRGQINIQDPDHAAKQRALLKAERVTFDANGFIPLRRFGWLPV
jgi:methylated-DNA-protein-cysteine methyltransferase-like protein